METLIFTNGTFSRVNESQCSVRSEASTICHSDNPLSPEGMIESSVDSEYFHPRSSDYSDSDIERSQRNEEYFDFRNQYTSESVDFDQITRNFNEVDYWQIPQFEAPNMEVRSGQFGAQNHCDNSIVHNSLGHLPCETQNIAIEPQVRPQHCDNTNYNYEAHTTIELSNMENGQAYNMPSQQVIAQNCDKQNDVALAADSLDLDTLQNLILEDFEKVTFVRRKVDKQLNSCNVNIHIEKILPELVDTVDDGLEDDKINFDVENFNLFNFLNDIVPVKTEPGIEEDTKIFDGALRMGIKEEPCSDIAMNNNYHPVKEQFKCKQEILPEMELKVEHSVLKNELDNSRGSLVMPKIEVETCTNQNARKPHIGFIPKVAGRKRIDMQAQKYIVDDDEENIDVETVTKGDNPVIEARDVDSLLAQFEATQFKESKKDKQSSKQKLSKVKIEDKHGKKLKNSSKHDKKFKDVVNKHRRNNTLKEDQDKYKNSSGVSDNSSKHKHKNSFHQVEGRKISLKQEDLKSKEKRPPSKSSPTSHNSQSTKPEEQKKSQTRRSADSSVPMKDSTRSDLQSKPNEKHGASKNRLETQQKSEQLKVSGSKSCSKEKSIGEVPKDLIGRIKGATKPRQIKLLDSCPFLADPVIEKKKNRVKSQTVANSSNTKKSATSKTVSCGTSMGGKSVSNELSTSPSRHSTSSIRSRPTATGLVQSRSTSCLGSIGSRPQLKPTTCAGSPVPSWQISRSASCKSVISGPRSSNHLNITEPINCDSAQSKSIIDNSPSLKPSAQITPRDTSRLNRLTTSTSNAFTSIDSQEGENDKFWHTVNLDHSYFKSVMQKNGMENRKTSSTRKNAESKAKQGGNLNDECVSRTLYKKINVLENNDYKCNVGEAKIEISVGDQTKEQKLEDNNKSNKPKKKIINWEDYMSQKRDKFKTKSSCSSPGSDNGSKTLNQEDWIKKMALDVDPTILESSTKTEQPIPTADISIPPSVPGMIYMETYDVSVNACVAEESALLQMETLAEIRPLLEKSNVKIDQSSLISCLTNSVPNNIPTNKKRTDRDEVVRLNKVIRHVKADRVKPKVCSVGVQTNISLIKQQSPKRSISISSSSSSDDESYESWDSRYSRHSRKRSRSSRSSYISRGSISRSTSPLQLDNPNIELPRMFRSKEENEEFKRDAELRRILFLGGIEDYINENFLYRTFERYGEIKAIKIYNRRTKRVKKAGSGESESYAFITFTDGTDACDAMKYYKEDYPNGENFIMCFGGRREFCKEQYSDLDNMPANFQYEKPHYDRNAVLSFDSMLEEYKKKRSLPLT